jgi:hypothetical protein
MQFTILIIFQFEKLKCPFQFNRNLYQKSQIYKKKKEKKAEERKSQSLCWHIVSTSLNIYWTNKRTNSESFRSFLPTFINIKCLFISSQSQQNFQPGSFFKAHLKGQSTLLFCGD